MRDGPTIRNRGGPPAQKRPGRSRAMTLACAVGAIVAAVTTNYLLQATLISVLLCVAIAVAGVIVGLTICRPPTAARPAATDANPGGGPVADDFLRLWAALEAAIRARVAQRLGGITAERPVSSVLSDYRAACGLTEGEMAELRELLTIRQAMTHGVRQLTHEHLESSYRLLQRHLETATSTRGPHDRSPGAPDR